MRIARFEQHRVWYINVPSTITTKEDAEEFFQDHRMHCPPDHECEIECYSIEDMDENGHIFNVWAAEEED